MLSRRAVNINCFAEVTLLLFSTALREWELCFTEDRSWKGPSTISLFYRHGAEPQWGEVVCQGQGRAKMRPGLMQVILKPTKRCASIEGNELGSARRKEMKMVQMVRNLPTMQETRVQSPGSERSPGKGNGNPLQNSCLENPMDRGTWRATVHGVARSRTRLSD